MISWRLNSCKLIIPSIFPHLVFEYISITWYSIKAWFWIWTWLDVSIKTTCYILSDFFMCKYNENSVDIISLKELELSSVDLGCSSIQAGLIHPSAFMVGPQGDDYLPVLKGQTKKEIKMERKDLSCFGGRGTKLYFTRLISSRSSFLFVAEALFW